ncbi:MAG: phosphoribosyltransferase [Nitrososphaeria archaeon]|nr:phosphoribosyltransferase [Conexivisphaerales archaeon]
MHYIKPSYEELRNLAFSLYIKIRGSGYLPDVNVGIGRGGLFVLRSLQDFFIAGNVKIPYLVIAVERYTGVNRTTSIKVKYLNSRVIKGKKVLLIDDVADQGISLKVSKEECIKKGAIDVKTATLHLKPSSQFIPDFYAMVTDAWIIYPWELYETIRQIIEANLDKDPEEVYWELTSKANVLPDELERFRRILDLEKRKELLSFLDAMLRKEKTQ